MSESEVKAIFDLYNQNIDESTLENEELRS